MTTNDWSRRTRKLLKKAGWHKGRDVGDRAIAEWRTALDEPGGFAMFDAAEMALREFGNLDVKQDGPGVDCARSSFGFDPISAAGEHYHYASFESDVGSRLYPLGEAVVGHCDLAIAEDGRVFLLTDDEALELGRSIYEAVDCLVLGRSAGTRSVLLSEDTIESE